MKNPYIDFLAAYGPVATGNAMYDELVQSEAEKAGFPPIEIEEVLSARVAELVLGPEPVSVILTGTAGDGKTYTARQAHARLSGNPPAWRGDAPVLELPLDGCRVVFVKDLSEMGRDEKALLFPRLLRSLTGDAPNEVFVLCVNDGQLIASWREHGGGDARAEALQAELRDMLREDREEPADTSMHPFRLINMSRRSHGETLSKVLDAMLDHPGWEGCPAECPARAGDICPIRLNRELLMQTGEPSIRSRLRSLIEITAADDRHLALRLV